MHSHFKISEYTPVAEGGVRRVYMHPANPDWLIKVLRPEYLDFYNSRGLACLRKRRRLGQYSLFTREIEEYLACHIQNPSGLAFTQKIVGLMETDLGIAIVVEAAKNRVGQLAPTIDRLIQQDGFGEPEQRALHGFIVEFLDSPVVVSDLHKGNLVFAYSTDYGDHFVMIDGLGSANFVPLKLWFPCLNRRSKRARVERLKRELASILSPDKLIEPLRP